MSYPPSLWLRRSVFGAAGAGVKDTNDKFTKMFVDEDGGHAHIFCDGCKQMVDVHMPDPDELIAECVECAHRYHVEAD